MKATYHLLEEPHTKAHVFDVLKKNADGTLDLGIAGDGKEKKDELRVGSCKVSAEPVHGQCVLDDGKAKPEPKAEVAEKSKEPAPPKAPAPSSAAAKAAKAAKK